MKRWQEDYKATLKQWKQWKRHLRMDGSKESEKDNQKGRFRKTHAFDCGIPHCNICHYSKYPKREKHDHELKSDLNFREQLKELE